MNASKHLTLESVISGEHKFAFWSTVSAASLALLYLKRPKKGPNDAKPDPGDFNAFLKVPPQQQRDPTCFDAFLKRDARDVGDVEDVLAEEPAGPPNGDVVKITVLFGTEYGLSKEVAEKLCKELRDTGKYW